MDSFPSYSRSERIADYCVHALGVAAGLIGAVVLIAIAVGQDDTLLVPAVVIYSVGLTAMLGFSALYNIAPSEPRKALFQRLDHAAIFVMIAGSYTPFALNALGGVWGYCLLTFVWLVALNGAILKYFAPHRLAKISTCLYLLLGWSGLAAIGPLVEALSFGAIVLLAVGGGLYSIGAAFHHWERLPFQNAIWHGFVLAAAACHYSAILGGVVLNGGIV